MRDIMRVRKSCLLVVYNEIDRALRPVLDLLAAMFARQHETELRQQVRQFAAARLVNGKFDNSHAERAGAGWEFRGRRPSPIVPQQRERAVAVDGDAARKAGTELVVEYFERQRPAIAGRCKRIHEGPQREIALSRERPVMPAPGEHVEFELRSVGKLDQEDPVAGNRGDRRQRKARREDMEAVEDDADIRLVGTPDDLPGVAIVGDMPAPGERLESHPKTTRSGALAEFAAVGRRPGDAAE